MYTIWRSLALPETADLPSAKRFAECIPSGTRPKSCLSSALETTLGKIIALGIPIYLPSAEKRPLGKLVKKTLGKKKRHLAKYRHVDIRQLVCRPLGVCRVSVSGTRQRCKFAECFSLALGKELFLPSVFVALGK